MINKETVDKNIKDSRGKYYKLKVASKYSHISSEDFLPEKLYCADAYRYTIYSVDDNGQSEEKEIDDLELKQAVVEKLKIIHKIRDPWDDDIDYFRKKISVKEVSREISMRNNIKDETGEYILLTLNPFFKDVKTDEFFADDSRTADYARYTMVYYSPIAESYSVAMGAGLDPAEIKRIKNLYYGIKDPWDDDPHYFDRMIKERDEERDRVVEENIRDENGNYCLLKLNPANEGIKKDNFLSDNFGYPDACRYFIYSIDSKSGEHNVKYIEDIELKDAIVKKLKKIYDIHDPWDGDPDYFHNMLDYIRENSPEMLWVTRKWMNNKKARFLKFGKNQVGERKIETFLKSEREDEMRELWRSWEEKSDMKVISWVESDNKVKSGDKIFRDHTIILKRLVKDNNHNWRLVYDEVSKPYRADEAGKKFWIDSEEGDVEFFKTYHYDDNVKVKLKRKCFGYTKKLIP